jgi:hypothetical protein
MAPPDYQVIGVPIQTTQYSQALGSVPGYDVTVRDAVTGGILKVFVPATAFSGDGARTLIEAALVPYREVAQLGQQRPPAAKGA